MPARSAMTCAVDAALNQMKLERVITQFDTNLEQDRSGWAGPQVSVWIVAQDEVSIARAKRWVQETLNDVLPGVTVAVYPDPMAGGRL